VSEIEIITPEWTAPPQVRAAFTLRRGGVSSPPFDSLNLGAHVGDVPEAVRENRRRVRQLLRLPVEPAWLQQVHGTRVADLDSSSEFGAGGTQEPADAAVTRRDDQVCVVQVADCMPVLFAARDGSAVAAAHAGWRGLAAGVLEATIFELGVQPAQLCVWLGPAIGRAKFEVGEEVRVAFTVKDPQAASAFTLNARGQWQCDLYGLARRKLTALGVREISGGGGCTYAEPGRFFSFRRDGQCGRMAALIWVEPGRT
jgi:YfiH family protein